MLKFLFALAIATVIAPAAHASTPGFIMPTEGPITSNYGMRWGRLHKGIDIAAPTGAPIKASAAGRVSYAKWSSGGFGNLVEISHSDGSVTLYAHASKILVMEASRVQQGEVIALVGSTGRSTGPHLHFEIHIPAQGAVNPLTLFAAKTQPNNKL